MPPASIARGDTLRLLADDRVEYAIKRYIV
jgi:hypothetical protein